MPPNMIDCMLWARRMSSTLSGLRTWSAPARSGISDGDALNDLPTRPRTGPARSGPNGTTAGAYSDLA